MKQDNYLKLEFPARSANEALARTAVASFAAQMDPTLEELGDIRTTVSEAVTNAIVHAYPEAAGQVWLRARILDGDYLEIVVKDKGRGISDIDQARQPLFTTGGEDRSGMGFTIMESFTDRMRVRSAPGKGTTVTLLRKIRKKN